MKSYEAKLEQLEKKVRSDVNRVKDEKERALDKVGYIGESSVTDELLDLISYTAKVKYKN